VYPPRKPPDKKAASCDFAHNLKGAL